MNQQKLLKIEWSFWEISFGLYKGILSPDEGQLSLQAFMIAADKAMLSWVCWGIIFYLSGRNYFFNLSGQTVLEFIQSSRGWRKTTKKLLTCNSEAWWCILFLYQAKQRCCDFRYLQQSYSGVWLQNSGNQQGVSPSKMTEQHLFFSSRSSMRREPL